MAFDKSVWGTPNELEEKVFSKAANGATASSYFADGHWNLGGWSTYSPKGSAASSPRPSPGSNKRS